MPKTKSAKNGKLSSNINQPCATNRISVPSQPPSQEVRYLNPKNPAVKKALSGNVDIEHLVKFVNKLDINVEVEQVKKWLSGEPIPNRKDLRAVIAAWLGEADQDPFTDEKPQHPEDTKEGMTVEPGFAQS